MTQRYFKMEFFQAIPEWRVKVFLICIAALRLGGRWDRANFCLSDPLNCSDLLPGGGLGLHLTPLLK